jgi:fermentation-respiration switch protein FrsA (DUF1100 family)
MILLYIGMTILVIVGAFAIYLLIVALIPGFSVPEQRLKKARYPRQEKETQRFGPRKDVAFEVGATSLSAWLYLPEAHSIPVPCIVMSHGLGATKNAGLEQYAIRFQAAGFAVLAFDYRHLGGSGGEPRQLVWIPYQHEDMSAAVEYARDLKEVDPARIALWGTSLSSGHVIVTAAKDDRISCVSAQCPLLDGTEAGVAASKRKGVRTSLARLFRMIPHGQRDLIRSWFGLSPHKIPLVGKPDRDTIEKLVPDDFVNEVCARILIRLDKYRPVRSVSKVHCPVLLQVSDDEISFQISAIRKVEERLGDLAEVVHYPTGHFGVYLGSNFEKCVSDQLEFFRKHLLKTGQTGERRQE